MKWLETAYIGLMLFIMVTSFVAVAVEPKESNPNVQEGGVQLAYQLIGDNATHSLWGRCPGDMSLGDITKDSNWTEVQRHCEFRLDEKIERDSFKGGGGTAPASKVFNG